MKKSFKIISTTFILFVSSLIGNPSTQAADLCFSNFPDSAWQNGEPQEVKNQLNYDLVGSTASNLYNNQKLGIFEYLQSDSGKVTKTTTYTYEGKTCSKRIISIQQIINIPEPIFLTQDQVMNLINTKSPDFLVAKEKTENLTKAIQILSLQKKEISQTKFSLREIYPSELIESISKARSFAIGINTYIKGTGCLVANQSVVPFFSVPFTSNVSIEAKSNSKCTLDWYFANQDNQVFKIGSTEISYMKNIDIKCIKGKLIKTVTGTNPQCPKGYKKVS